METRNALHVRDVGGLGICIMQRSVIFLDLKLRAMNPSTLLAVLQLFSAYFCQVFCDDDSKSSLLICCRQLLIEHVIVSLHVVVSDVHHRTFINIEIHYPLVCPLNKFIDISCSSAMSYQVKLCTHNDAKFTSWPIKW